MSYKPGLTTGKLYRPESFVVASCFALVAMSVSVTPAPGTAAPCGSLTRPVTLPDEAVCAATGLAQNASESPMQTTNPGKNATLFICSSLQEIDRKSTRLNSSHVS